MDSLKYWLFLACSITLEVAGTSIMKASQSSFPLAGMLVMYALLGASYYFLARAVVRLPIGVAYAFWEAAGLVFIVLISVALLGEALTLPRFAGLVLVLGGSMLIHRGTLPAPAVKEQSNG